MTSRPLGLFDQEIRQRKLQALGDPLVALNTIVPWAIFRTKLESMRNEGRDPRKDGRPPHDQRKSPRDDGSSAAAGACERMRSAHRERAPGAG